MKPDRQKTFIFSDCTDWRQVIHMEQRQCGKHSQCWPSQSLSYQITRRGEVNTKQSGTRPSLVNKHLNWAAASGISGLYSVFTQKLVQIRKTPTAYISISSFIAKLAHVSSLKKIIELGHLIFWLNFLKRTNIFIHICLSCPGCLLLIEDILLMSSVFYPSITNRVCNFD